jgi:hypothetical protein
MTKIIAFAGRKQSGKTTSSEMIMEYFEQVLGMDNAVKIYNFADSLKQNICMDLLGLTYDQCYGSDEQKNELVNCYKGDGKQMTAREVMQFVGTDFFRKMKENIWVDATINKIEKEKPKIAIVADCRFPDEVEAIKKVGGTVIKLMRNPFNSNHASESALDPKNYSPTNFDIVIFNNNLSMQEKNYAILTFLKKKGLLQL